MLSLGAWCLKNIMSYCTNLLKRRTVHQLVFVQTTSASRFGLTVWPWVLWDQWFCEKTEYVDYRYNIADKQADRTKDFDPLNYGIDFPVFGIWLRDYFDSECNAVMQQLKDLHMQERLTFSQYAELGLVAKEVVKVLEETYKKVRSEQNKIQDYPWNRATFPLSRDNQERLSQWCQLVANETKVIMDLWRTTCVEVCKTDQLDICLNLFDQVQLSRVVTISEDSALDSNHPKEIISEGASETKSESERVIIRE